MINELKLVKEAVARRDLVPIQTCFHFYDKRVQAFNGSLRIDAPFDYFGDIQMTIPANKFFTAAKMCKGDFKYKLTATGKLSITKSKFRAMLPLMQHEDFPRALRNADTQHFSATGMLEVLKELRSFVSEDASRLWSRSILFKDGHAYATNNIVIAKLPTTCMINAAIPVVAIDVLLNLDVEPLTMQTDDHTITFNFSHDLWMQVAKIDAEWPDVDKIIVESEMEDLPPYFAETIENLLPFCDDPKFPMINLGDFGISTSEGASEATVAIGDFADSVFRAEPLLMVAQKAHSIAFSSYPRPSYFEGDKGLCGMLVGVKR